MGLRIRLAGHVFDTGELTLEEGIVVEQLTGKPWTAAAPGRSASDFLALGLVFLGRTLPPAAAIDVLAPMTFREITAAVESEDG